MLLQLNAACKFGIIWQFLALDGTHREHDLACQGFSFSKTCIHLEFKMPLERSDHKWTGLNTSEVNALVKFQICCSVVGMHLAKTLTGGQSSQDLL